MKHNQMLEYLGFGISTENDDLIVYYLERDPEAPISDAISVVSDLSDATYYHQDGSEEVVKGPLDSIRLIQKFFEKPIIKEWFHV